MCNEAERRRRRECRAAVAAGAALLALVSVAAAAQETGVTKDPRQAPQSQMTMTQTMAQDVREIRAAKGADRETTYLTKMMDHHQSGIDMARLALEKSQNAAVRREAKQMIDSQTKEIAWMRAHLKNQHRMDRTAKPDPRMQPMMDRLQARSGVDFDRAFAREMIGHHEGAIAMSGAFMDGRTPHRPVRTMAQRIIRSNRTGQRDLKVASAAW